MPTAADYAKIHIATKELGIDDDSYRDLLYMHFQVRSAKELAPRQVTALLNKLRDKGWQPKNGGKRRPARERDNFLAIPDGPAAKQQRKILAMWSQLGYEVEKLHKRCQRSFGIDRFEWVTEHEQLHILITDLGKRLEDAGK